MEDRIKLLESLLDEQLKINKTNLQIVESLSSNLKTLRDKVQELEEGLLIKKL